MHLEWLLSHGVDHMAGVSALFFCMERHVGSELLGVVKVLLDWGSCPRMLYLSSLRGCSIVSWRDLRYVCVWMHVAM